jgi:hypothetical protein
VGIDADFECIDPMWLQSIRAPDALHAGVNSNVGVILCMRLGEANFLEAFQAQHDPRTLHQPYWKRSTTQLLFLLPDLFKR